MRTSIHKGFVQRAVFETLEARQLLSVSPTPNEAWSGSGGGDANGGNDYVAPGMSVPSNAAEFDGATMMQGSQTISLTLSNLPSHTLLNGYQINVGGVEGTFNVDIGGVASGTMTIAGSGFATWADGTAEEYPEDTNASHTSDSLTITVSAQLSNESDYWQVTYSQIDVTSYVGIQDVQDGSMNPEDTGNQTPGIFQITRSNNDGPASSDQPLSVYFSLDQSIADTTDSNGDWISSLDGSAGQFHGPTFDPGGTGLLVATIPAGQSSVNVSITPTNLVPQDIDNTLVVNASLTSPPDATTEVGYQWGPTDNSTAAVNMAARDPAAIDISVNDGPNGTDQYRYKHVSVKAGSTATITVYARQKGGQNFTITSKDATIADVQDPDGTIDANTKKGPRQTLRGNGTAGQSTDLTVKFDDGTTFVFTVTLK